MYAKGLAIQHHLLSVSLSLTAGEIIKLRKQDSEVENQILTLVENQILNTLKFSEGQTETKSFAKAMNQAENGTIVIIGLTKEDAYGIIGQNEEIENNVLEQIDSQCRSAYKHKLKLASQKEAAQKEVAVV